jgi:hypothetical protein
MSGGKHSEGKPKEAKERKARADQRRGGGLVVMGEGNRIRNRNRNTNAYNLPSSKRFPTSSPATRERFLFGMSPLVSLHVFHTPNMESQCKLICRSGGRRGARLRVGASPTFTPARTRLVVTHLKRLLQYLHGSVFGFWFRFSPFSSPA